MRRRSTTRMQSSQWQLRYWHSSLCPFIMTSMPWLRQRVHFGLRVIALPDESTLVDRLLSGKLAEFVNCAPVCSDLSVCVCFNETLSWNYFLAQRVEPSRDLMGLTMYLENYSSKLTKKSLLTIFYLMWRFWILFEIAPSKCSFDVNLTSMKR